MFFLSGERDRVGQGQIRGGSLPSDRVALVTTWTYLERRRLVLLKEEVLVRLGTRIVRRRAVEERKEGRGVAGNASVPYSRALKYPAPTSEDSRERDREREKTRAVCPGFGTRALTPTQAKA